MKKTSLAIAFLVSAAVCAAGEVDVAREALRDGLWEVARTHAARIDSPEARAIVLESYGREGRWDDLLKTLGSWSDDGGELFAYYRALALVETGRPHDAEKALGAVEFKDPACAPLAARLRARLAMDGGDATTALKILKDTGFSETDAEAKLAAAQIFDSAGDRAGAEKLWREVVADTNADERAFTLAAANLRDAALLERAYADSKRADMRLLAGLRLGRLRLASPTTFEEGAKSIAALAKDSPDSPESKSAYIALADAYLEAGRNAEAEEAYRVAVETWPDAAKSAAVHEGRGWALRRLGKNDDAAAAFARAEEAAVDDVGRAKAALEQGDALSDGGRGEEAMAKYRLVLEKYPKTPSAAKLTGLMRLREMEAKGRELCRDYRFKEAQELFAKLAEEDPSRKPRADYLQMLCLYGQGLDREACEKAAAVAAQTADPGTAAEASLWLAKLAYNRRRWREAFTLFEGYSTNRAAKAEKTTSALLWAARAAFAANEFDKAISLAAKLTGAHPDAPENGAAYLVQGESLIELARFDDAILVLERAALSEGIAPEDRLRSRILKADALFAMGADNPARYREALEEYRAVRLGEKLAPGMKLTVSYKIGRTLEKLKLLDDAIDHYYTDVVLAYRKGRESGVRFDDEARIAFARAAMRLADEYESRGRDFQAISILRLVSASDVPAAKEAEKRIERIQTKGSLL